MKHETPRAKLALRDDEQGVAAVLGAILMLGILISALVVIQTQYVPVWDGQRERDAAQVVAGEVATIKSDLGRLTGNQSSQPISDPVTLARQQGFNFFQNDLLPGIVAFTPSAAGAGMTVSTANPLSVQQADGQQLYSLSEDWTWNGAQKGGILDIVHLRFRIPAPGGLPTGTQTLDFTVLDTNNNCRAQIKLVATGITLAAKNIEAQVFGAQAAPAATCASTAIALHDTYMGLAAPAYYHFDAFAPETQFASVMAGIPSSVYPLKVQFSQGNTAGQVAIVYDQATQFGTVRSGGAGLTYTSFNQAAPTGTLTVSTNNQRLPDQDFVFEYGALFLEQPDGAALIASPSFAVSTTNAQAALSWSFPALTGGSAAVTGSRSAEIVMSPAGQRTFLQANAQDITFTITTSHAAAWRDFWDQRMQLAGLSSLPVLPQAPCAVLAPWPQYAITETPDSATLTFFGPCSAPSDATKDVFLTFEQTPIAIELRPTG